MAESLTLELPGGDPYEVTVDPAAERGLWLPDRTMRRLSALPDDTVTVPDADNRALAEQHGHDLAVLDAKPPEPWEEELPHELLGRRRSRYGKIGLTSSQVTKARKRYVNAVLLGYYHRSVVHYTQGGSRWQGIAGRRLPWHGQYPNYADCSAYDSWGLWVAMHPHIYGHRHLTADFVNGDRWLAGYTGTMTHHGVRVRGHLLPGDQIFYGGSYWVPGHVAGYIGSGRAVSFGSEIGPLVVTWNYRPPVQVRRYLRYS